MQKTKAFCVRPGQGARSNEAGDEATAASNAATTLLPTASRNPYASLFTSLADDPSFKTALQEFISGGSTGTNYGTASRANDVNTPF